MTRERIEDIRKVVLPLVKHVLLKINYENLGKSDAEEFTRDFNETLDLAIKALEQEPKTGHWIFEKTVFDKFGNTVECSSCRKKWKTYDEIRWRKENKFCPCCGSDNREVVEE